MRLDILTTGRNAAISAHAKACGIRQFVSNPVLAVGPDKTGCREPEIICAVTVRVPFNIMDEVVRKPVSSLARSSASPFAISTLANASSTSFMLYMAIFLFMLIFSPFN